jgi:predicted phage terminase large subunit-like protein
MDPKWTEFIPHEPTVKQHAALLLDDYPEVLYGGAAGGGKSDFLLMAALQYVDVPGYAALILRRTFSELALSDGMMLRAQEWLSGRANGIDSIGGVPTKWNFPSGARLEFGHVHHDKDRYNYKSAAYQFIGFDELTGFPKTIYLYLRSRLRRMAGSKLPIRTRCASNPGDIGHDWVKERFVTGNPDAEVQRVFLPATLADNPYLDQDEYEKTLQDLHPYDREQLLNGNWDARPPGGRFKREWFKFIDEQPAGLERVRRWDLAATEPKPGRDPDYSVGVDMGRWTNGSVKFVISDVQRFRESPAGIDGRIVQVADQDGRAVKVRIEQEPGSSGKIAIAHFANLLEAYDFKGVPSTGDKVVRSNAFAAACERGEVALVRAPWNEPYLRELEMFTGSDKDCPHDDQVDASGGAHTDLTYQRGLSPSDTNLFSAPAGAEATQ